MDVWLEFRIKGGWMFVSCRLFLDIMKKDGNSNNFEYSLRLQNIKWWWLQKVNESILQFQSNYFKKQLIQSSGDRTMKIKLFWITTSQLQKKISLIRINSKPIAQCGLINYLWQLLNANKQLNSPFKTYFRA